MMERVLCTKLCVIVIQQASEDPPAFLSIPVPEPREEAVELQRQQE